MIIVRFPSKANAFLIFTISIFLLSANSFCSKTTPCPGYDGAVNRWFPYADKEILVFKSTGNLYDTLYLSMPDSTMNFNTSRSCTVAKSFIATNKNPSNYPDFSITLTSLDVNNSNSTMNYAAIYFTDQIFTLYDLNTEGFGSFTAPNGSNALPRTMLNYSLNGIIYPVAQSITTDSTSIKKSGVYKITYAKNNGIIAFESNPGGVIWIKQ